MTACKIVYECPDWVVFEKPHGVSVQELAIQYKQNYPAFHPCHRLDKETSGLWLVALTSVANQYFSKSFQNKSIHKTYLAITGNKPLKKQGRIIGDMKKSRSGQWMLQKSKENPAETAFKSLGYIDGKRLVVCFPLTGKTHQIRVAMKSNGTPIVGDALYGKHELGERMHLHAYSLSFVWNGQYFDFVSHPHEGKWFVSLPPIKSSDLTDIAAQLGLKKLHE